MKLSMLEYLLIGSTMLEFSPLFQAVKSVRTKSVKDVSFATFASMIVSGALWLSYGISITSVPIIVGNGIKLSMAATVVGIYFLYRKKSA